MDALVQFFAAVAAALVATALGHFGVAVETAGLRNCNAQEERVIQRSRTPEPSASAPSSV